MLANSSVTSSAIADPSEFFVLESYAYRTLTGTDTIEALGWRRLRSVTLSTGTLKRPFTSEPVNCETTRAKSSKDFICIALQSTTKLSCYLWVDPQLQCRF